MQLLITGFTTASRISAENEERIQRSFCKTTTFNEKNYGSSILANYNYYKKGANAFKTTTWMFYILEV